MLLFVGVINELLGVGINKFFYYRLALFEIFLPDEHIPTFPGIKHIHNPIGLDANILLIKRTKYTNSIAPSVPLVFRTIPNPNSPLIPINIHKPIGHKLHH